MLPTPSFIDILEIPSTFYVLSDGAKLRYAILEPDGAPRGTILVAQGRREFIEKKYAEIGFDFLKRGYRVILFDWRGMGQSTRSLDGKRYQYNHMADLDLYVDDLRAVYRDVVKPRHAGPLILFCHSLGSLIATRWLAESMDTPDVAGIIMTAPALAIGVPSFTYTLSRTLVKMGYSERYAVGLHNYGTLDRRFPNNVLSHDPVRFGIIEKYFDGRPDYAVGGVTWGWLATALRSINKLKEPGYMERIKQPVLALCCGRDIVTPPVKTIPLLRRIPHAEVVTIRGARHDLMSEADEYRDQAWRWIDGFLGASPSPNKKTSSRTREA